MGNEILIAVLVLALLMGGSVLAGHVMGWLMDRKLMGYTIVGAAILWLISDPSNALAFIGIAVGLVLLFSGGGRAGGYDRDDDDGGG